jgi:hypothetical protein
MEAGASSVFKQACARVAARYAGRRAAFDADMECGRRLRAVLSLRGQRLIAEFPDRNAELLRFVGEIGLDAGARKHHDTDRQHRQHGIVALEGG